MFTCPSCNADRSRVLPIDPCPACGALLSRPEDKSDPEDAATGETVELPTRTHPPEPTPPTIDAGPDSLDEFDPNATVVDDSGNTPAPLDLIPPKSTPPTQDVDTTAPTNSDEPKTIAQGPTAKKVEAEQEEVKKAIGKAPKAPAPKKPTIPPPIPTLSPLGVAGPKTQTGPNKAVASKPGAPPKPIASKPKPPLPKPAAAKVPAKASMSKEALGVADTMAIKPIKKPAPAPSVVDLPDSPGDDAPKNTAPVATPVAEEDGPPAPSRAPTPMPPNVDSGESIDGTTDSPFSATQTDAKAVPEAIDPESEGTEPTPAPPPDMISASEAEPDDEGVFTKTVAEEAAVVAAAVAGAPKQPAKKRAPSPDILTKTVTDGKVSDLPPLPRAGAPRSATTPPRPSTAPPRPVATPSPPGAPLSDVPSNPGPGARPSDLIPRERKRGPSELIPRAGSAAPLNQAPAARANSPEELAAQAAEDVVAQLVSDPLPTIDSGGMQAASASGAIAASPSPVSQSPNAQASGSMPSVAVSDQLQEPAPVPGPPPVVDYGPPPDLNAALDALDPASSAPMPQAPVPAMAPVPGQASPSGQVPAQMPGQVPMQGQAPEQQLNQVWKQAHPSAQKWAQKRGGKTARAPKPAVMSLGLLLAGIGAYLLLIFNPSKKPITAAEAAEMASQAGVDAAAWRFTDKTLLAANLNAGLIVLLGIVVLLSGALNRQLAPGVRRKKSKTPLMLGFSFAVLALSFVALVLSASLK